jgi:molybdate transport system ATP-binding protein
MLSVNMAKKLGVFNINIETRFDAPITGVFGPSGAGKSTLLQIVTGLMRPDKGRIVLDDEVLFDSNLGVHVPAHRRRIGLMFQDDRLFPHYSVRRNLEYGYRRIPSRTRRFHPNDVIELLEIGPLLERRTCQLSGGEKQRIALGRAILGSPRMLLLDEPLSALDARLKEQILPFLQRACMELAIPAVIISHQLEDILSLTDHLLLLDAGRKLKQGPYRELLTDRDALVAMHHQGLMNVLPLLCINYLHREGMSVYQPAYPPSHKAATGARAIKGPLEESFHIGQPVQVMLRPQDIALALAPVEYISMQNQLPGCVERVIVMKGRTMCLVNAGLPLLVEITHLSQRDFDIHVGQRVWCLFKAQSLRVMPITCSNDRLPAPLPEIATRRHAGIVTPPGLAGRKIYAQ